MKKIFTLRAHIVLILLLTGCSVAFAHSSRHYSRANAYTTDAAAGSVYVSTNSNTKGTTATASQNCDKNEDKDSQTYCFTAERTPTTPGDGYTFDGWWDSETGGNESPNRKSTKLQYNESIEAKSTNEDSPTELNRYARWHANTFTITLTAGDDVLSAGTTSITATYNAYTNLTNAITKPTRSGNVFDGYYTEANGKGTQIIDASGDIIANAGGGSTYTDANKKWKYAGNIELYAKWISKYDFEITGGNYTINNEAWNKTSAFTFVHADEAHMTTTIQNTDVISYDRATNTITAKKVGTSKITFTQNTSTTVKNGSLEWTITVDSVANNLAISGTSFTRYVDQEVTSVRSNQNSNGTISTTSSNPNLAHYDIANNKIVIPNSDAQKLPFDNVTITIFQEATAKYKAKKHTITLTVQKNPNTIYVKGNANYSSSIYTDSYDNGLAITATNTDYSGSPIQITQTDGADIATYYPNDNVVYSSYKLGTATWTLSQPENYKYQAGSGSFTVNVILANEGACRTLLNDPTERTFNSMNDNTYVLDYAPHVGDTVYFDMKKLTSITTNNDPQLQGYNPSTGKWEKIADLSFSTSWTSYKYAINNDNYTKIKWYSWAENGSKSVRNVRVIRRVYLNVGTDNSGINGTLTVDKKSDGFSPINPSQTGEKSTTIYWSCAGGGDLKIVCDNPHFSFSQNEITGVDCNKGTTDVTVFYTNTEAVTETATVTVYSNVYRRTFTVKGVIEKAGQLITWHNDILRLGQSYNDVATANTLVTYESSDESIIRVDEDDEGHKTILTAVGTGTVNITATAEESSFYTEKSDTKSIKVTEKQIQWIDWNQSLFGLKLGGANVTMNAVAASDVEGCVSSRLIEYSSNNESIVKVVNNNQLQIIGVGTAIITAVQAGGFDTDGHDYERAETEKTVIVRDPNAPCESYAYQQGQEVKMDCGWNALDKQTRTSEINFNGIIPATGTLRYKGEYRKVAINYFDGTMTVEQYIPGENWQPVTGGDLGKPSIGTYKTANLTFDRRATKMRVKVTDGLGYHYFTDCQVTQARFIETTAPVDFNLNVGQQQNQVIYLSYSNIADGLSLTLAQGANSHFSVDKSFIEGSCGSAAKNVALTITYHPTAEETNAQDVLTITDGTTSCQVVLTGSATRVNRHIIWDHADETDIYTVQTETLSAEARTDLNELAGVVTFSLASSSTATGAISMENVLSFTSAGVANVVAYTTDDARYNAAPNVTKVFNVSKTPTTISTLPVLAAVTSGTAVGDVELTGWQVTNTFNGGVVEGTLAITSADLINVGTNTVTLSFTPDNTDMYVGCTSTTTIVVNKATSVATPSAANIVYGQTVNESELSNEGTAGTWSWTDARAEDVLDAGTYNDLAVHFKPTSGNYTEQDATVTLTVEKANPEVTAQASAITYGQAISASSLTTKTGNVDGSWSWAVDATQVLSVGNHDLKANFSSNDANYNNLSNVDVTLTVNKIETQNVDVPLSFCAGGSETFHGRTYTEAGSDVIEAIGATRDTVYNVTVTILQPTVGADSKTITVGAEESWNGINLSGYAVGSHSVVAVLTNAAGCDSTVTLTLTVNPLINEFTNATGDGDWNDASNWTSGVVPTESAPDVIINGDLIINSEVTIGNLTIEKDSRVVLTVTGDLTVNGISEDREEYGNMYVENGGEVEVNGSLAVGDLTVEASIGTANGSAESGQVVKAENIVYANAYIEINMDPNGVLDDTKWYGFTVPFDVDAREGISRKENGVYRQCTYGTHYMFAEYDANKRLNSGKGWKYITGNTLQAGTFYYLTVDGNYNTYRFKAKNAAYTQAAPATLVMNGSTSNPNANWNAVGNSTLQHVTASFAGGEYVQVYMNGKDAYKTVHTDEATFVVGCPFFIQAKEATTLMLNEQNSSTEKYYAPRRMSENSNAVARINLSSADGGYSDQIYFSAADKEQDAYIIGQDLSKAGESKVVPQLWMAQYNQKLSVHEAVLSSNSATCPLGIFVPQAGSYTLDVERAPENTMLYLTYNGRAIWNLTYSPYVFDLTKGTTEGYGLKMYVMQVATDLEESGFSDQNSVRKVLIDDVIYIVTPEGKMYDITGKSANY